MTEPFGNISSSAAIVALPSGSMRINGAGCGSANAIRSKPKQPTHARPRPSTTMSLSGLSVNAPRSAWTLTLPSGSRRRTRWSFIETINIDPSGSHPRPAG